MAGTAPPAAAVLPVFVRLAAAVLPVPLVVFLALLAVPRLNVEFPYRVSHFFVVTMVSLLAAGIALIVVRAALRIEQRRVLLIALGFVSMAALFAVHALSTPGIIRDATDMDRLHSRTVLGLSASLSLVVPSLLFAAGYARWVLQALRQTGAGRGLVAAVLALVGVYAVAAVGRPDLVAGLPLVGPASAYALAALGTPLYLLAAWQQSVVYVRARLPFQGALAAAFLLLALAQVVMAASAAWTVAWWEYHVLMLAAVVLALGALFVELDRRRGLERFLPAEVVDRVVAGDFVRLAGERRTVTVLFADLRGSTALAEDLPAGELVAVINEYVGVLARCVFTHGGMLDKFLGDGIMAVFGIVPDASGGAVPAARAALDMRRAVARLNGIRAGRGQAPIGFGVGLHTGEVVLGAIGTEQRSDFTAIGDTVNTAARLQEAARDLGVDVALSEQTASYLHGIDFTLVDKGPMALRGKAAPVRVYALR